eukprot:TRINITY_DN3426_c0_g1_i1.p1 TRINITY_DN3426_c0_g1~~TRINITY_DN3426_c0_g1_i1.p1  ORF type:complete len:118 (-),score=18.66 TRINITY_DN3426_c0_g1_i1:45-398(-)
MISLVLYALVFVSLIVGSIQYSEQITGGWTEERLADIEVKNITLVIRNDVETFLGQHFADFLPVKYISQVVSGVNYIVKVYVGSSFLHVKIYRHWNDDITLLSLQNGKTYSDPIEPF